MKADCVPPSASQARTTCAATSGVHLGRRAASNHAGSVFVVAVFVVIAPRTLRPLVLLHYLGWIGGLRRGWLLVDGNKGYDKLFTRQGATALEVGCWSHCRRYFVEALEAGDTRAALPLSLIGRLFEVEREADEQQVDEAERLRRRDTLSRPITEQLGRWVANTYNAEPPKSPLAQACRYAINQWKPLLRFLEDARLPLHNNTSELRLREIAVGRKNYLFAGSDAGAERAACVYTLVATCVLAGVDPWAYLADVLEKLAQGWPQRRLEELLPPMWKASREAAARAPSASPATT